MARNNEPPRVGYTSGIAKAAADYLIREKGCRPVYNMLIRGKEFEGQFYVNNRVMTVDDMIAYAKERGFDPMRAMG